MPISIIFLLITLINRDNAEKQAFEAVEERQLQRASRVANRINGNLQALAQIARSTASFIEHFPELSEEHIHRLVRSNVQQHDYAFGSGVAFAPFQFQDKSHFAPKAFRRNSQIVTSELSSLSLNTAPQWDGWRSPLDHGKESWTAPYKSKLNASNPSMITFSAPIMHESKVRGVVTIDIALQSIAQMMPNTKTPGLEYMILSREGDFIIKPDALPSGDNIYEIANRLKNNDLSKLFKSILATAKGRVDKLHNVDVGKETYWISSVTIPSTDWTLSIYRPESKALERVRSESLTRAVQMIIVVLLLVTIVWFSTRAITTPLIQLQRAVRRVASGKLNTRINIQRNDELGVLARDITYMTQQLSARDIALMEARSNNLGRLVQGMRGNYFYYVLDAKSQLRYVSPSVHSTLGVDEQGFAQLSDSLLRESDFASYLQAVRAQENPSPLELCLNHSNGQLRYIEIHAVVGEEIGPQGSSLEIIARDITRMKENLKTLEQAKNQAESANHAKSQFLSNMSHELRTPLNGILGYAQLLQKKEHDPQLHREGLHAIKSCGQHLLSLINDVLDLSKIESGQLQTTYEPVHLRRLIRSVYDVVKVRAQSKQLKLNLSIADDVPAAFYTDEIKLKQILINLIGNAIKFTDSGYVDLEVSIEHDEMLGGGLKFSVNDSGTGLHEDELELIFKPFGQTSVGRDAGGTGLGLAISQRLAKALGGELAVSSRLNEGSQFYFSTPLRPANLDILREPDDVADTLRQDPKLEADQSPRILVADDQQMNRKILVQLLQRAGFRTLQAANGQQALDILEHEEVDAVLMDIRMPIMDGLTATRAIRANPRLKTLKVIAVTASVFSGFEGRLQESGCDDYIGKPFVAAELFAKLAQHLGCSYQQEAKGDLESDARQPHLAQLSPHLAQKLATQLRKHLELGDIAAIKQLAEKYKQTYPEAAAISLRLNTLCQKVDLECIGKLSEELDPL